MLFNIAIGQCLIVTILLVAAARLLFELGEPQQKMTGSSDFGLGTVRPVELMGTTLLTCTMSPEASV